MAGLVATFRAGIGAKELHIPLADAFSGTPWWWTPGGSVDLRPYGDGGGNSAVFACLRVKTRGFIEAPPRLFTRIDEQWKEQPGHRIEKLLRRPNRFMTGSFIGGYITYSKDIAGDAYLAKRRSAAGLVVELWPLRPDITKILSGQELTRGELERLEAEPNDFIAAYEYTVQGKRTLFAPRDIVHIKPEMPNPKDMRHGAAAVQTVMREVMADEEAGQYAASLVKNMGMPGVIFVPEDPDDEGPDDDEADAMIDTYKETFGGRGRGKPMIVQGGRMKPHVVAFSPEQMDFKTVRRLPEERVSAVTGVPAILAGLGAGMERNTFANWQAARESMAEDTTSPDWENTGQQWTEQLGPDFGLADNQAVRYDTRDVRALQPDKDKAATRMNTAVVGGWAMVSEARGELGLPVDDSHAVFLRPIGVDEVPAGDNRAMQDAADATNGGMREDASLGERVNAAGQLIRSGFSPQAALEATGLDPIEHLGLLPVTLRTEEAIEGAGV